jgi:uncharacterized protein (DUF433 family)/DNA-binding transcriptional MerR regulator
MIVQEIGGAYTGERAAALSGVPRSTVHYWARNGQLVPSVSLAPRLWSFTDLLALRILYWLRQSKKKFDHEIPASSMPKIMHARDQLLALDLDIFDESHPVVVGVTLSGDIIVNARNLPPQRVNGQLIESQIIDVLAPFEGLEGTRGPDLRRPRPTIRIVPRKISGAPHIAGTRLPTQSVYVLKERGFSVEELAKLYPFASFEALSESVELEGQLHANAQLKAA